MQFAGALINVPMSIYRCLVFDRIWNCQISKSQEQSVDKRFITKCPHPPLTPYRDSAGDMHRKYCEYILIFQEKSNIYLLMIFVVSFLCQFVTPFDHLVVHLSILYAPDAADETLTTVCRVKKKNRKSFRMTKILDIFVRNFWISPEGRSLLCPCPIQMTIANTNKYA